MDKYYEPDLEEFHQGFEYERWSSSAYTPEKYIKEIFEFVDKNDIWDDDITNMLACAYNGGDTLRVKYLDKEDIESLGFTQIAGDCFNLPIKEYRGRLNDEVRILFRKSILIYLAMNSNDKDNVVLFTGIVKNKSELIKLLKQLKIE
jgi:hypothetical protein